MVVGRAGQGGVQSLGLRIIAGRAARHMLLALPRCCCCWGGGGGGGTSSSRNCRPSSLPLHPNAPCSGVVLHCLGSAPPELLLLLPPPPFPLHWHWKSVLGTRVAYSQGRFHDGRAWALPGHSW
jgi:hypothetical protein